MANEFRAHQSIAAWNDHGITHLHAQKFENALSSFRTCLAQIATSFPENPPVESRESLSVTCPAQPLTSPLLDVHVMDLGYDVSVDHNTLILHASTFVFPPLCPVRMRDQRAAPHLAAIASGVVLFNLGLTYHLWALQDRAQERDLKRVIKIYSLAEQVLERANVALMDGAQP